MSIQTRYLAADDADISAAADILRAGGRVAFPTETVYGLGADARSDAAVASIYEAKDRPAFNPLIVHCADGDAVEKIAVLNNAARTLAGAFWPGALTLVLPITADAGLSRLVTAGLSSVAVRVPAAPVAQQLLTAFGGPIAAPSANPSGRISATSADHVRAGLNGRIEAVLDGGPSTVGLESTIIDLTGAPTLLRPGGIPIEALEQALGSALATPSAPDPERPSAPGMLQSHYAPRGRVRLNVTEPQPGEMLLGFGAADDATLNLSPSGDLSEAAANLFEMLHALDQSGATQIAVSPIPATGLGRAINDRLTRAAAPRPGSGATGG